MFAGIRAIVINENHVGNGRAFLEIRDPSVDSVVTRVFSKRRIFPERTGVAKPPTVVNYVYFCVFYYSVKNSSYPRVISTFYFRRLTTSHGYGAYVISLFSIIPNRLGELKTLQRLLDTTGCSNGGSVTNSKKKRSGQFD